MYFAGKCTTQREKRDKPSAVNVRDRKPSQRWKIDGLGYGETVFKSSVNECVKKKETKDSL